MTTYTYVKNQRVLVFALCLVKLATFSASVVKLNFGNFGVKIPLYPLGCAPGSVLFCHSDVNATLGSYSRKTWASSYHVDWRYHPLSVTTIHLNTNLQTTLTFRILVFERCQYFANLRKLLTPDLQVMSYNKHAKIRKILRLFVLVN